MADVNTAIASYQLDMKNAGYVAGAKQVDAANQQMVVGMGQVEAGSEGVTVSTAKIGNEFTKLEAKISRRVAIEQQLASKLEQVTRVGEEEGISTARVTALKDQYIAKANAQIAAIDRVKFAAANQNMMLNQSVGVSRGFGSAIQQAGFQVGDFAVQVASGSGVLRPLIQQGTQLISMFGVWGSVIGAAGAVLGALVVGMGLFGESAEDKKIATERAAEADKALIAQEKLLKEAMGAVDDQIVKNIGSLSRYASVQQDAVNSMLATQGGNLRTMIAERDDQRKKLDTLLLRDFESPSRAKMERDMAADIAKRTREIETQNTIVLGLARQATRLGGIVPTWGMETTGTTPAPTAASGRQADQAERANQAIEDQIDALAREEQQIRMTARERAIDVELQRAEMTARNGNIALTAEQILNLTAEAGAKFDSAEASKAIVEAEKEREEAAKDAAREAEKASRELDRQLSHTADAISDQASALASAALGWEDWRDVASQALNLVFNELAKFSKLGGSGGGIFDLLFGIGAAALGGGLSGASGTNTLGSGSGSDLLLQKASGGDFPANTNVLVGERGPELIRSRVAGNVVPNHALGGTVVYQSFDFRGAMVDTAKIRAEIGRATPGIVNASEANVSDKRRRGALRAFA